MSLGGLIRRGRPSGERQITGGMVLAALFAFFGFVILVNIVMVRAAITTFGGVDTPSSYQAGLDFKAEEAKAAAQAARNWQVDARIVPTADGAALTIDVRDGTGRPVTGADLTARLAHPVDERRDIAVVVKETGLGVYSGRAVADPGQWTLDIEIAKGGERLFRSRNRITLQ
jgi:nitrogen fixation protein FixH